MNPDDTLPPSAEDTIPPELASTIPSPPPVGTAECVDLTPSLIGGSHPFYPIALDDESLEDD